MIGIRHSFLFATLSCVLLLSAGSAVSQVAVTTSKLLTSQNTWQIVVNNGVLVPGDTRAFNSFNQPSINVNKLVVFRGRSKAGKTAEGEPAHGIFLRDMSAGTPVATLFDRKTPVPQPNNLLAPNGAGPVTFTEPPSFPRIDMWSNTIASRGSHMPVWEYQIGIDEETGLPLTTRAGTTGIYTNAFSNLITGASNLGLVPQFGFFRVPEATDQTIKFDVFPGAPAVADSRTIVFKGNYSLPNPDNPDAPLGKTGVYYRTLSPDPIDQLSPAGGIAPVVLIANSSMPIPGTNTPFGSTAPPSAVGNIAVFAGFDNEDAPQKGGIYRADLNTARQPPPLTPLVQIGGPVPGVKNAAFNKLGEGLSFDGRFIGFWGAWGSEVKDLVLQCPLDGNKNRIAYCQSLYGDGVLPGTLGSGFHTTVPLHQGIFVHDIVTGSTWLAAKTPEDFSDFVYWNFSGEVPAPQGGTGGDSGGGEDGILAVAAEEGSGGPGDTGGESDGEPARWRSASFVAVSGLVDGKLSNGNVHVAFKATTGELINGVYVNSKDGIYLRSGPDGPVRFSALVETGMAGTLFDPQATYIPVDDQGNPIGPETPLPVTTMGIERDGFRGNSLALNIGMGNEEAGWAGIYLTQIEK